MPHEDIFGTPIPSPATAKAPDPQAESSQPVVPEPSPVQPRTMATLDDVRDILRRLNYGDMTRFVKGVQAHQKSNASLAEALALWADSDD
jgi:hypothetical protein